MDKRLDALGTAGLEIAKRQVRDGDGVIDMSAAIRSVMLGIQQSCGAIDPIIMRQCLLPYVPDALRNGLVLIEDTEEIPATCWIVAVSYTAAGPSRQAFALSAVFLKNFNPTLSMSVMPSLHPKPFVARNKLGCREFIDNHYSPAWCIQPFPRAKGSLRPNQVGRPALIAGFEVVTAAAPYAIVCGPVADVAAGVLLVQESEGVATYLDGSPIIWRRFVASPLILAASQNVAARFRPLIMHEHVSAPS